jgi:hypothetical protein
MKIEIITLIPVWEQSSVFVCQMPHFQTKTPDLGKFLSVLQKKMLYILWPFGIFYGY